MLKAILATIAGYAVWTIIWLGGALVLFAIFPEVRPDPGAGLQPVTSVPYLVSALALSLVCSLAAGFVAALIAGRTSKVPANLAALLLITGVGVQTGSWDMLPVWYNIPFLLAIVPLTLLGARLAQSKKAPDATA